MYSLYIVQEGDTLDSIARKTGVSSNVIANINSLEPLYTPQAGDKLVIPIQNTSIFERYEIKKGDSLYKIAQLYNTTVDTLAKINGLSSDDYIYPGNILLVPRKGIKIYVTEEGDTISKISKKVNVPAGQLLNQNPNVTLAEDQMIIYY